jgi:hypothetical protein
MVSMVMETPAKVTKDGQSRDARAFLHCTDYPEDAPMTPRFRRQDPLRQAGQTCLGGRGHVARAARSTAGRGGIHDGYHVMRHMVCPETANLHERTHDVHALRA